jgi:hypothetical protein
MPEARVAPDRLKLKFCRGQTAVWLVLVVPAEGVPTQGASGMKLTDPVKKRGLFAPPMPMFAPPIWASPTLRFIPLLLKVLGDAVPTPVPL